MNTTETTKPPFAIVPQALIAAPTISATDKIIFSYLFGKYQTKTETGEPWTFSSPSIAKGTGLHERNVRRRVKIIRKHGVLKLYGSLMNGKKRYDVFVFVPGALETLISTADKMSVVIPNDNGALEAVEKHQRTNTADNLSAEMSAKKKMVEGRLEKEDVKSTNVLSTNSGKSSEVDAMVLEFALASKASTKVCDIENDKGYQEWLKRKSNPLPASGSIEESMKQLSQNLSRYGRC